MNDFDARTTGYLARAEGIVAEHGWAVQGVFPRADDPDPGPPFAYTVGLSGPRFGHPEFVVFGLAAEVPRSSSTTWAPVSAAGSGCAPVSASPTCSPVATGSNWSPWTTPPTSGRC